MFPAWPAEPSPGKVTRHDPGAVHGSAVFTAVGAEELNRAATAEPSQCTYPNAWGAGRYWALCPKVTENHEAIGPTPYQWHCTATISSAPDCHQSWTWHQSADREIAVTWATPPAAMPICGNFTNTWCGSGRSPAGAMTV
ncbi:hypothetical protein AB0B56_08685 [Streptosporangium canum]|uniref:hypothetical protein n=1 Tax=Streptosporangium canum TaxID=324952 RepID=UPI0034321935